MFDRGFKAWCETYAKKARIELRLAAYDPLPARLLAQQLKIRVWTPDDVPGLSPEQKAVLLRNDGKTPSCWSAVTLIIGIKTVVIVNSSHSPARQSSDLMHELAHLILKHQAHEVDLQESKMMLVANYDKKQEEEADWLSASILLPRESLVHIKSKKKSIEQITAEYGVSKAMLSYRLQMTGVNRQFA
jgi:Zn-dependent peptidase ImmA (M78 family)